MCYCINPRCPKPQNPDNLEQCQACSSSLTYSEFLYRAIGPLGTHREMHDTRLYEVTDYERNLAILKVLTHNSYRAVVLFERETEILYQLIHVGIPRFIRNFIFVTSNGDKLRCLVREKIEGQNLEQWLETHESLSEAQALKWLKQLAEILYVVHGKGFLHQDIKPSNIIQKPDAQLVLIDFSNGLDIISVGYTPPEQAENKAVPQSDFFALGRTFVHLLTRKHPLDLPKNDETQNLTWRSFVPQISSALADLIDDLMAPSVQDRPDNAKDILSRIACLNSPSSSSPPNLGGTSEKKSPRIGRGFRGQNKRLIAKLLLSIALVAVLIYILSSTPKPACDSNIGDYISCGEEILFDDNSKGSKQAAINAVKEKNDEKAIEALKKEPEILIYWNNAQLEKTPAYTIAAVVPVNKNLGTEILRGIAQAQDEINQQKIYGKGLRVVIADDDNDRQRAKNIAEELVKRTDILGIVGHYTSEISLATVDIYQKYGLVLISYGSTSTDLSSYGLIKNHVFFRTVPTTEVPAMTLAIYLATQATDTKQVAVFYNPQSSYSRSLRDRFKISIETVGGKIVSEFDLCQHNFNAGNALKEAENKKVTAIALFPDGQSCDLSRPNALRTIEATKKNYPIADSWILSGSDTLKESTVGKLVVAVSWHRLSNLNSDFLKVAKKLWGEETLWNEGVNGVTATAYDAVRVLVTALETQPKSRTDVQKVLADKNFKITDNTATGEISFLGGDRKEPINVLLKVIPSKNCNSYSYSFVPINYSNKVLDCNTLPGLME